MNYTKHMRHVLAAGAATIALVGAANAQAGTEDEVALAQALNNFAAEADIEILFEPALVAQYSVSPSGDGDANGGLEGLLAGTGLTADEIADDVFVIRASSESASEAAGTEAEPVEPVEVEPEPAEPVLTPTSAPEPAGQRAGALRPGRLRGAVLDETTGAGLAGAIVTLEGTDQSVATNTRGEYRFSAVPPGQYRLVVDYLGLNKQSAIVEVEPSESTVQDFQLPYRMDTITVFGSRSSLAQALNQQRSASNASTVVAADLLGSFPAETVSEALRRVPGVAFERDDATGEGARVSVRGFNSEAINIQLNGLELQGTGIERTVDLSSFLADNISQITIQKSLLPSQEATGSGGLVEIETRSGLDYDGKYFSVGLEREQSFEDSFGDELQASLVGAYEFTPDFGVVGTLQFRETDRSNLDVSILGDLPAVLPAGYTSLFLIPESYNFPFDAETPARLLDGGNFTDRQRKEENISGSLNFAWDIADHTSLRLDAQYIQQDVDAFTTRSTMSFLSSTIDMPVEELGGEVRRRNYIRALRPTVGVIEENSTESVTSLAFRGETNIDAWTFNYKLGYTDTERDRQIYDMSFLSDQATNIDDLVNSDTAVYATDDDAAMTERLVDGAVFLAGDGIPVLSLSDLGRELIFDPATYYLFSGSYADTTSPTESLTAEASSRYTFSSGLLDYVEVGAKVTETERANSDDILSNSNVTASDSYTRIVGQNTYLGDLISNPFYSRSFADVGVGGYAAPFVRSGTAKDIFAQLPGFVEDDPNTPENEARFNYTNRVADPIEVPGSISPSIVTEDKLALYLESMLTVGRLEVVGGVRFEQTDRASTAVTSPSIRLDVPGSVYEPRETLINAGLVRFDQIGGTDETWTPSLLATWRQTDQLVARFGYFRSTTNPDIRLISRPSQLFLDLRESNARATIREPNPDLDPTIVDNFDIDIAYYFKDNPGLLRAAFFLKETSNNFTSVLLADESANIRERVLAELEPLAASRPDLLDLPDDTEFFLNRPRNGEGGKVYGVEVEAIRQLDFLPMDTPAWVENIQLLGNVTWTDGDFETLVSARDDNGDAITLALDRPFLRQSEWSGTASVSYEDKGFSSRLIYSWQSESVAAYDEFNLNTVIPDYDTLDLRLSYAWGGKSGGPSYVVFMESDDLLTDPETADVRTGTGSTNGDGSEDFFYATGLQFSGGRTFTLGAKVTF